MTEHTAQRSLPPLNPVESGKCKSPFRAAPPAVQLCRAARRAVAYSPAGHEVAHCGWGWTGAVGWGRLGSLGKGRTAGKHGRVPGERPKDFARRLICQ
jgi:hypothetical protein